MDKLVEWIITNVNVGLWVLILFSLAVLSVIILYAIAFIEGREISFWPPRIGEMPVPKKEKDEKENSLVIDEIPEPLLISGKLNNSITIPSDFILFEKCTILIWIWITPQDKDLRDAPSNRYILAHYTDYASKENETFRNQFCFRYSLHKLWQVTFSNQKGEYPSTSLYKVDELATGWHHFYISWDKTKPELRLIIDGGRSGSDLLTSFVGNWPESASGKVTVGSWVSSWEGHFCNTKLYSLKIYRDALSDKDRIVLDHIAKKPL